MSDKSSGAIVGVAGTGGGDNQNAGKFTTGNDGISHQYIIAVDKMILPCDKAGQAVQGGKLRVDHRVEVITLMLYIVAEREKCVFFHRTLFMWYLGKTLLTT